MNMPWGAITAELVFLFQKHMLSSLMLNTPLSHHWPSSGCGNPVVSRNNKSIFGYCFSIGSTQQNYFQENISS
jgi:hypothetical protein